MKPPRRFWYRDLVGAERCTLCLRHVANGHHPDCVAGQILALTADPALSTAIAYLRLQAIQALLAGERRDPPPRPDPPRGLNS